MPLAFEVDDVATLAEPLRELYAKDEKSGKFRLAIDGLPQPEDTAGLKKKNDELLAELKKDREAKKKAEEDARLAAEDAARKKGDVTALEQSWKTKYDTRETELKTENDRLNGSLNKVMIDSVAKGLATELALQGSAGVLEPHIRNRLKIDWVDNEPVTRVLGADGKASALTLAELKSEFAANPAFKPVIAATKASGGGAGGAGSGGGAAKQITRADFEKLDPAARIKAIGDGITVTD